MDEQRLADLVMRDADFGELERVLDVFCPFEAVGMVRQEIRHAHFLAYYLDPNRPHGFGDACLRAFLTEAVAAKGDASGGTMGVLDVHLMDLQGAVVRREWRHMDLLVEVPERRFALAVELKIDASEGAGQLGKYVATLKSERPGWSLQFVFLTRSGGDASEEQSGTWAALGLDTVETALRRVAQRPGGESGSRSMLLAYLDMLRRHHLSNDRLEQLAADLWRRHREALEFLAERQPNLLSDVMRLLVDQQQSIAAELAKATGLQIVVDSNSGTSELRFAVADWDDVPGLKGKAEWTATGRFILVAFSRGPDSIKAYIQLGRGDKATREDIYRRLKKGGAPIKSPERFSSEWKRLASETLARIKDDDEREPEALAEKLRAGMVKMAKAPLVEYDKVLRSAIAP